MEASNGNSLNRRSLASNEDEAANLSIFRRRNKIIAVVFILLVISLTLFIGALIVQLLRIHNAPSSNNSVGINIPPIVDYCFFSNAPTCSATLNPIIINKFITDPNQILAVSLQTVAICIQRVINTSSTDASNFASNNCSNSLRDGLGRIRESLATIRVNPFVESLGKEERAEMKNQIVAAEEDVESCLDDEPPEMTAKLVDVQVHLISAADFVDGYAKMGRIHIVESIVFDRSIVSENMFGICMCGLQLLFIVGLFCSLFRIR